MKNLKPLKKDPVPVKNINYDSIRACVAQQFGFDPGVRSSCYAALRDHPEYIKYIQNQTEEMQVIVVSNDPMVIEYIEFPCEMATKIALTLEPKCIGLFNKLPDTKMCLYAIGLDANAIHMIPNPTKEMVRAAIWDERVHPALMQYLNPENVDDLPIYLDIIKKNPRAFTFLPTELKYNEKFALSAIARDPNVLEHIPMSARTPYIMALADYNNHGMFGYDWFGYHLPQCIIDDYMELVNDDDRMRNLVQAHDFIWNPDWAILSGFEAKRIEYKDED